MYSSPNIDIEVPYQNAADREERYEDLCSAKAEDLWVFLADEENAKQFIDDYLADPNSKLAEFFQKIAQARLQQLKIFSGTPDQRDDAKKAIRLDVYWSLSNLLESEIEHVAKLKTQNGMYSN